MKIEDLQVRTEDLPDCCCREAYGRNPLQVGIECPSCGAVWFTVAPGQWVSQVDIEKYDRS